MDRCFRDMVLVHRPPMVASFLEQLTISGGSKRGGGGKNRIKFRFQKLKIQNQQKDLGVESSQNQFGKKWAKQNIFLVWTDVVI